MRLYGLTGGIGAGKSAAAGRFSERGVPVMDADSIGHAAIEPGGVAEKAVVEAFGENIVTDGTVDRQKLADCVFGNPEALARLNALVHPAVVQEIGLRSAELAQAGHEAVIVEAALHAENGELPEWMEGLIVVACPEELRVARLVEQRGMSPEDVRARMAAQTPPEKKIPLARWVVYNDGTRDRLNEQVDQIAEEL